MKKRLPFLFFFLFIAGLSIKAQAQTSITAVDYTPQTGDHFKLKMANYVAPGNGGANQTWNFSSMVSTANATNDYVTRANAPFPASVPAATLVSKTSQNEYQYLETLPNMIRTHAAYSGAQNLMITYSNPVDIAFPMNYNVPATDAYRATFTTGGMNFIRKGTMTITYDGYGTLTTPSGTFNNVMRVKMYDVVKDSSNVGGSFPYVLNTIMETYDFILPGVRYPIARVLQATVNGTVQTRGMYLDVAALGNPEELAQAMGMELYPNPASNGSQVTLNYNVQNTTELNLTLVNMLGQEIKVLKNGITSGGKQTQQIPVSQLAKGVYFVRLTTAGQVAMKRLVVQ